MSSSDSSAPSVPASLAPGSVLTLTPHDLNLDGGSVARHGDMVVFLDKGLPGETLRASIISLKPRFATAEVIETVTPSPLAVGSYCQHAGVCGGCAWPTFPYSAELAWKEKQVKETFRRLGKVVFAAGKEPGAVYEPIVASPRDLRYRNKVEFAFGASESDPSRAGSPLLGLKRRASHQIVEIDDCPLATVDLRTILTKTRAWAKESGFSAWDGKSGYLRFLVVRRPDHMSEDKPQCLVELITNPSDDAAKQAVLAFGESLLQPDTGVSAFLHSERTSESAVAYGEKVRTSLGPDRVWEKVGPLLLEAPSAAFLQTNTQAAALLYSTVKKLAALAGSESVWDLYSGVGGIALFLADAAKNVRGFESSAKAVIFAKRNAEQAGARNVDFIAGEVAAKLAKERAAPDLVVTDPPRAGLDSIVVGELLRLAPRRIILVGCDPATMARDAARLSARYETMRVQAVDMFPHTPHVEAVALLQRRD